MATTFVFDAYGTLFDVHSAVRRHAESVGDGHAALSNVWRAKQLEYTWTRTSMDRYVDFWQLTQQALDYAFSAVPNTNRDARQRLLDAYWELEAFDEVRAMLVGLKEAGKSTAILSNGSPGMLDAAVVSAQIGDLLDATLSVDALGFFKTRPETYQLVCDRFDVAPTEVSFQSSNRWDIAGAHAFGFRTVWCNRSGAPDEYLDLPPDRIVSDLTNLLEK
ncbi:MAG: haloacid dehalogenase type II [Ahrensia sp.]|nr:haloacid dehalogenase type II [Ahrensia sp.]